MGLLPMYRASDISLYTKARIHMFVYLADPSSTSYETELAYLQEQGIVADSSRFKAYHYDIGEAVIGKGREYEQAGRIIEFAPDEYMCIYRVDAVNEKAQENVFDLNEEAVEYSFTDPDNIRIKAGSAAAICGVVKPWQMDKKDFIHKKENIYEIRNSVNRLHYTFDDGTESIFFERELLMQRIDKYPIGSSVYEFYNIFKIDEKYKGKDISVRITACDNNGEKNAATASIKIHVI